MAGQLPAARSALARFHSPVYAADAALWLVEISRDRRDFDTAANAMKTLSSEKGYEDRIAAALAALRDIAGVEAVANLAAERNAALVAQMRVSKGEADSSTELSRDHPLFAAARVLAADGDGAGAAALAVKITGVMYGDGAYTMVAAAAANAGDLDGTKTALARIKNSIQKSAAEVITAYAQVIAGDLAGARATAAARHGSPREPTTAFAYGLIAAAQLDKGDADGARQTLAQAKAVVEKLTDRSSRSRAAAAVWDAVFEGPLGVGCFGIPPGR